MPRSFKNYNKICANKSATGYYDNDKTGLIFKHIDILKEKYDLHEIVFSENDQNIKTIPNGKGGVEPFFKKWCKTYKIGRDFWPNEKVSLPIYADKLEGKWTFIFANEKIIFYFVDIKSAILFKLRWHG
jgi:hypothetical protein